MRHWLRGLTHPPNGFVHCTGNVRDQDGDDDYHAHYFAFTPVISRAAGPT